MPTVLEEAGYKFIIFTNDHPPAHVHVKKAAGGAKVRLETVEIAEYKGLTPGQLRQIHRIVEENRDYLMGARPVVQQDESSTA